MYPPGFLHNVTISGGACAKISRDDVKITPLVMYFELEYSRVASFRIRMFRSKYFVNSIDNTSCKHINMLLVQNVRNESYNCEDELFCGTIDKCGAHHGMYKHRFECRCKDLNGCKSRMVLFIGSGMFLDNETPLELCRIFYFADIIHF